MTVIRIGRKDSKEWPMEFSFQNAMDAFVFYSQASDSYREDDMEITMTEEGEE